MQNPSYKLRNRKKDLSPYLFHFTKGDDCKNILHKILDEECLRAERGYICFTESPLTSSNELFEYMYSYRTPMYSKYGIGFNRDVLIDQFRARPVIYGDNADFTMLGNGLKWRFELLDIHSHDYTWLREWRIEGNEFNFSSISKDDIIVVAPTDKELKELVSFMDFEEMDFSIVEGIAYPSPIYRMARIWKGFSFDEVIKYDNDNIVDFMTMMQDIDETIK